MKLTLKNSANGLVGVLIVAFGSLGISGGPVYPLGTNVVGTYAGVMVPSCLASADCANSDPTDPTQQVPVRCKKLDDYLKDNPGFAACEVDSCTQNSEGIFSITVPDSGISTGTFVMFAQGRVFSGNIQGTADAGKQTMSGVLHATYDFTKIILGPPRTEEMITAEANGSLNAKITRRSSRGIRLTGFAALDVSQGSVNADNTPLVRCHIPLTVGGFKQ
jgi:hypothetical protein